MNALDPHHLIWFMPAEGFLHTPCNILRSGGCFFQYRKIYLATSAMRHECRGTITMRIIIFANGDLPDPEKARALLRGDDFIIAADGGMRHILALGLVPNVIVGDLDSLPENFDAAAFDSEIVLFPKDKNETDLELALQHALTLNPDSVLILAALGGRMDQSLANLALLSGSQLVTRNVKITDGVEEIFFCRDQARVEGRSGDLVSLIPWGGEVTGVVTSGLKWALQGETLYPEKTRGISNEMTGDVASVSIQSGLLLVVHQSSVVE